jgi:ABC-2 type transport system ATP-binding protein
LDGLDLELRAGEVLAVLGPNGAGKTTAVRLLLGLRRPTGGSVQLFGVDPASHPETRQRVGVMLQISGVPETLKVREHLELFRSYYPRPLATDELVAAAGLAEIVDRKFGELSGGQRQRLLFALALAGDPDLLILDEPTVGLDVDSRRGLWREIRRAADGGRSVLLATHYLDEADALADRVAVLARGRRIAEGTPAEIRATVAGRKIRGRTTLSAAAVAVLAEWPGVTRAELTGDTLTILASQPEPVVARLLAKDPELSDLEVTGAGLEEAFLALTHPTDAPVAQEVTR